MQHNFSIPGLTDQQVLDSRQMFGRNATEKPGNHYWPVVKDIVTEPMFLLLAAAASVYFLLGENQEGAIMVVAIVLVAAISFFQDSRSRKALLSLRRMTEVHTKVLRNGIVTSLPGEEIVIGDLVVVEEGALIPADGKVVQSNDFAVNESVLTGESFTVWKSTKESGDNTVYQGTVVSSGLALMEVTAIGAGTRFAAIGKSMAHIKEERTPLQWQIQRFVRGMAFAGALVFLAVWLYNYVLSGSLLDSLVKGLTLAMSVLPEEIPVAFTTFMALGAWRLMKSGIIVKNIKTVETLGSATVVCADKTGTITENRMELREAYVHGTGHFAAIPREPGEALARLIEVAMWASEPVPFDPMEKALHDTYQQWTKADARTGATMIHEYPLSGSPPMMTHVFQLASGVRIIASKGAPETVLRCCVLEPEEKRKADQQWKSMAAKGFRVLAVAAATGTDHLPREQQDCAFSFLGFVAFYDPPKSNISRVVARFYDAGIEVKMITGDTAATSSFIAREVGIKGADEVITGEQLMPLTGDELSRTVQNKTVFARMFPEAKLKIIDALKRNGEIVAMTGDGVNDGPALKAAHIGIAMGKRGSEVARQASALILIEDDLDQMVEAVAMGRKIYGNLKRAIQYIISIHIPIIFTVALPLFLGWKYPFIFTPVHVIFLELIMGPTCSIVYENEPLDKEAMFQRPRALSTTFLQWHELRVSIVQGLVITLGVMLIYQASVFHQATEDQTRTMVFATMIFANIFLTLVNRSFNESLWQCLKKKNNLITSVIAISVLAMVAVIYVPALQKVFNLFPVSLDLLFLCLVTGLVSVVWFEGFKRYRRAK
jgi:P-type Ca2+ transporter type 2C